MNRVKNYIRYRCEKVTSIISQENKHRRAWRIRNNCIFSDSKRLTEKNKVNLHYWQRSDGGKNLGDDLSPVICDYLCRENGIDSSRIQEKTKHLYAIGSILGFGCQNATVWGSGVLEPYRLYKRNIKSAKLDVRAVRGPLTREYLLKMGVTCPAVYGDPAILMPYIYQPASYCPKNAVSVIYHYAHRLDVPEGMKEISISADDYKMVIDEIIASRIIISSSLHGIILAETYGVPAIYLNEQGNVPFKFKDYYYSTGRYNIPVIRSVKDYRGVEPAPLPCLREMQTMLIQSFPTDIWEQTINHAKQRK